MHSPSPVRPGAADLELASEIQNEAQRAGADTYLATPKLMGTIYCYQNPLKLTIFAPENNPP